MNILKQLSIKNLKLNKKRTISTIIGVILSVALICAVATFGTSFRETLLQNSIIKTGYYHLKISNINEDDINQINNNRDVKSTYTISDIGWSKLENGQNENKPYLNLYSMNDKTFENLSFKLKEGRFPIDNTEIIISDHIIDNGKVNYKVGDKIKLEVGEREDINGYRLNSNNAYSNETEKLVDIQELEFTIVGIIKRPDYSFESYSNPAYTVITTNMDSNKKDIFILLKRPSEYKQSISKLLGVNDYEKVQDLSKDLKYDQFKINTELLRWEVFAFSDDTVKMLYSVCAVVIFIILFTSVFCIRNSFAIATTEKIKMYGMLASVGATKKQIRKNVIFEAMIIGLIGIPIGIISGIFAVFILLKIVNAISGDFLLPNLDGIVFNVSILPILLSTILGFITIYLSSIFSAKKASKVSPIEGLRNLSEIKIKNKKLKTPKIIYKLFKTGGVLAYKNLKRSKKKYRTTVISLTVSIFVFITMNSFISNVFDFSQDYYASYDYNVIVYGGESKLTQDKINNIIKNPDIKEYFICYDSMNNIKIADLSKINQSDGIKLDEESYIDEQTNQVVYTGKKSIGLKIFGLNSEAFKKYVKKIGANYEKVKASGILCDEYKYYDKESENTKIIRRYKYSKNDIINGTYNDENINIKIGAVTDTKPYGLENIYYESGFLVVDINEYKNFNFKISKLLIETEKPDSVVSEINNIDSNIVSINADESVKELRAIALIFKIFLYGFIAVISLIGVTNIFNTITSNMELRQKEFAMLKSIGMTKKEFNRMINLETIFYGTKSLIYGITFGLLGTFAMYKAYSVKIDRGVYIPINAIIISVAFVFILTFIIMKYSINKINKQNTIETIRKENI